MTGSPSFPPLDSSAIDHPLRLVVDPETYTIVHARQVQEDAVITLAFPGELTLVLPERKVDSSNVIRMDSGWRLLSLAGEIPLGTIGFFARITTALADAGVGVDIYSGFSTDYLLVKNTDLDTALLALAGLGIHVQEEQTKRIH